MSQINSKRMVKKGRKKSPLPLLFSLGGVLLLALAAFAIWGRGQPESKGKLEVEGAPRLKVDREKIDLGDVRLGETVRVSFELSNVGDQPLRFSEAPFIEVVEGC